MMEPTPSPDQERLIPADDDEGPTIDLTDLEFDLEEDDLEVSVVADPPADPAWSGDDPPAPAGRADRLERLVAAGQAMRRGIRAEIEAATGSILEGVLEQARAELFREVERFETDMRTELETVREDLRRRVAEEALGTMNLEARLDQMNALLAETRDAVFQLRKRYLPGSQPVRPVSPPAGPVPGSPS
ncbi:MAG: hypothetical protein HY658_05510 [Actinobacteria bacterium]|nr:hypothetical protein [Actinomycetota bacterium]